jgi:hypothetical protein
MELFRTPSKKRLPIRTLPFLTKGKADGEMAEAEEATTMPVVVVVVTTAPVVMAGTRTTIPVNVPLEPSHKGADAVVHHSLLRVLGSSWVVEEARAMTMVVMAALVLLEEGSSS